jgi:hypothetical protein
MTTATNTPTSLYEAATQNLLSVYHTIAETADTALMIGEMVASDVLEFGNYLGKEVKTLTDKALPKPLNAIVQKIFNSAPFIAACLILPAPARFLWMFSVTVINISYNNPFHPQTYANIYYGNAFCFLTDAAKDFVSYTATGNFGLFIATCLDLVFSGIYALKAEHAEEAISNP